MPLQIIWGNDLNACNNFIQDFIGKKVSNNWRELNITNLNGDESVKKSIR